VAEPPTGTWHKPAFWGPQHASAFQDSSVVGAYQYRPPYPEALFGLLGRLLEAGGRPARVLDLGCGSGAIARRLVQVAEQVDALDVSAPMLELAQRLPGGDAARLRWILGPAEDAPLDPPYALAVAAASLHWMDWSIVLPRLADALTPSGLLAIVDQAEQAPPWQAELVTIIRRYSTNPRLEPGYDWIGELERRGWFRPLGREQTPAMVFDQSLEDYIASFHGRASFSRERMGARRAAAFDAEVRSLVAPYAGRTVSLQVMASVVWGRPQRPAAG
jgi:SAM-dependent methyltransferase